jgi:hypothetical protein
MSRQSMRALISALGMVVTAAATSGCETPRRTVPPTEQQEILAQAQVKREQTLKQLQLISMAQLADELAAESKRGREPFNSMAYAEALKRPNQAAQLDAAVKAPDRSSLLGLLALRHIAPELYGDKGQRFRISVLVDALKQSRYFNAFGLPHAHWEEAAQALISEGEPAARELNSLLGDDRPAPVWGSEDYSEYRRYDYRVQDYAAALIFAIRKRPWVIPVDRQERLRAIAFLR